MSETAERAARKKVIVEQLMALEANELEEAEAHQEAFVKESILGAGEEHDTGDLAASRESADLAAAFDHPVMTHHAKIDVIENMDFAPTDVVAPGAVVSFGGKCLIVVVSTHRFDVDGVTYMGISEESPIYKAMAGLKAGESFTFHGKDITIEDVL
ncbi:hypothetical protein [Pseudodonghicola xiamenensis]|uniref:Uncharacterized protein n=1 Tax=Pseudodonghicola xiamenensis TaxID=337702 RepID=A0A8J3H659_9RHOB|nr:hypothetical protein [Pseudodonghicola xiamenensis]GHG84297.1 hypothetical protein GCM10010961_10190 [Pseudodonghicola xiamenensis]